MQQTFQILRYALFWDIKQRRLIRPYRRFGTTCQPHLQGLPLNMGPKCCPEISARNYQYAFRNIPKRVHISSTSRRKPEISHLFATCEPYTICRTSHDITRCFNVIIEKPALPQMHFSYGNKIETYEMVGACRMHLSEISCL
jgi:hypothetical protein